MNNKEFAARMREEAEKWENIVPVSMEQWLRIADLIEYIRTLEHNYNVAVSFNENQAKYIESLGFTGVVRCKDCRWAKPYERTDGKTGYYCQFCGHSFKYGTNWERLYNPIKESDDCCSYGERK